MKKLFLGLILVLSAASLLLYWTAPERETPVPLLYWITGVDEVKLETIEQYKLWREEQGLPPVEVKIDNSNRAATKKLTQGLAGVGGDILDIYTTETGLFASSGMLMDVTEKAKELGFGPEMTYPALKQDFVFNGRQYGFPRNTGATLTWVNRATFAKYGIEEPPEDWTWDDFERIGRAFVTAANPPGTRKRVYFLKPVSAFIPQTPLRRGLGLSVYNETMTKCILDDPRNTEVMERLYRWVVELRLIPTTEEQNAMSSNAAQAGRGVFHLFVEGRYAMLDVARWGLIYLRPFGALDLRITTPAQSGFRNVEFSTGMVSAYAKSKHPEAAMQFIQFLTSERFNLVVARGGDGLTPVPKYVQTDEFMRPPDYPNEWEYNKVFARVAPSIGISLSRSPFVLAGTFYRIERKIQEQLLAGRLSPEEAGRVEEERLNREIALSIRDNDRLRERYEKLLKVQAKIDERKARGELIPAEWVLNPFHQVYYKAKGLLEEPKDL